MANFRMRIYFYQIFTAVTKLMSIRRKMKTDMLNLFCLLLFEYAKKQLLYHRNLIYLEPRKPKNLTSNIYRLVIIILSLHLFSKQNDLFGISSKHVVYLSRNIISLYKSESTFFSCIFCICIIPLKYFRLSIFSNITLFI